VAACWVHHIKIPSPMVYNSSPLHCLHEELHEHRPHIQTVEEQDSSYEHMCYICIFLVLFLPPAIHEKPEKFLNICLHMVHGIAWH